MYIFLEVRQPNYDKPCAMDSWFPLTELYNLISKSSICVCAHVCMCECMNVRMLVRNCIGHGKLKK